MHLTSLILAFAALPAQDAPPAPPEPFRALTYEQAAAEAEQGARMLLVVVAEPDSEALVELRKAWSDDAAFTWADVETVAIELDPTEYPALVEQHRIRELPTTLLLEPDGQELDRIVGGFKPRRFVRALKGALALRELLGELHPKLAERPDDPHLHHALAQAFMDVGRLAPAVEAFDRAWNVGRGVDQFERIRTGHMLSEVTSLTHASPLAKKLLGRWRREALARLELLDEGAAIAAKELSSLHGVLKSELDSVEVYERMRARAREQGDVPQEVLTELFNWQVVGIYHGRKRYAELAEGFGDMFLRVDRHFSDLERWRTLEREGTLPEDEAPLLTVKANVLHSRSSMYVETLLRVGREDEAVQLVDLVLLREQTSGAYAALMRAARRGGSPELSREIADRGLALLEDKELEDFTEQVDRFFKQRER